MVSIWIIIGLILATLSVSVLAATFSIVGLGALFSGAALAVFAMASSLEFAKFVLSAYIHQRWNYLNKFYRSYLVFAVVVLSLITSLGIFGFLSDAYQSAQSAIDGENIKLESLKTQQQSNQNEIARLNKSIDEIPTNRVSKRMALRAEIEPALLQLNKLNDQLLANITQSNLRMHEIKKRVGPLIYIARAFQIDLDTTVKYLILIFVSVFDPLAICLVIATSQALDSRRKNQSQATSTSKTTETHVEMHVETHVEPLTSPVNPPSETEKVADAEIVKMRFSDSDENKDRKAV